MTGPALKVKQKEQHPMPTRIHDNLKAALDFLKVHPKALFFPATWEGSHCPKTKWSRPDGVTSDPARLGLWLNKYPRSYLCIALNASGLCVLDIDVKGGKRGDLSLMDLELEHGMLPVTYIASTPSIGMHHFFVGQLAQTTGTIGVGLDTVGMVPCPGSMVAGKGKYAVLEDELLADVPEWLITLVGTPVPRDRREGVRAACELDLPMNLTWAEEYLKEQAPEAVEGAGGDATALKVAMVVRDRGLSEEACSCLMHAHYADKCSPYEIDWLEDKVRHAYRYAHNQPGVASAAAEFTPVEPKASKAPKAEGDEEGEDCDDEIEQTDAEKLLSYFNSRYAVISIGGKVRILAKEDQGGDMRVMTGRDFELWEANGPKVCIGEDAKGNAKYKPGWKWWLEHAYRDSVDRIVFKPAQGEVKGTYNLFRGFDVTPYEGEDYADRCHRYREHVDKYVCGGDPEVQKYLWAWLADLMQHPGGRKPGVAVVMQGGQGAGKGSFVIPLTEIIGKRHSAHVAVKGRILGRFNALSEGKILGYLDEAIWHGDKETQGALKVLITEKTTVIEKKYQDPVTLDSHLRVIMATNDIISVNAEEDARRYLCLEVISPFDRMYEAEQYKAYFDALNDEMAPRGDGQRALLRYLLEHDGSGVDLACAPKTAELDLQKLYNMTPIQEWICERLETDGLTEVGETDAPVHTLFTDFISWCKDRQKKYFPNIIHFARAFRKIFPQEGRELRVSKRNRKKRLHLGTQDEQMTQFRKHMRLRDDF